MLRVDLTAVSATDAWAVGQFVDRSPGTAIAKTLTQH
jgi:hypothetical protein